ncbi:DUF1854 domain-containing protein [Sutcliffiella sp. NC1]|uniref:DUF1854 domain-containing protein n=1 Tax=Sutcliffiella sp. NC1 TaxID=3004096 RepID=UPI0022DD164F|nr:DUF1854 domain-containing protein [Sutcliffiella sp. NC1]WBL14652.1 DUF1854 domain-containing protein [Sutcliffiella sp. NC1]
MTDDFSITLLDSKDVSFVRDRGGLLTAHIQNKQHKEIYIYRTFPYSKPYEYISVRTKDDEELGIIKDISDLDRQSEQEVLQELRLRYVVPVVTRIASIKEVPGLWTIELETDRGNVSLLMRNVHEHIQQTPSGSIVITDMEGRRCELRDINLLDKHSLRELNKVI